MGVGGLWTYCKDNLLSCGQRVDLVQVAKQRDGIVLLVDYYSFEFLIIEKFWSTLSRATGNPYLKHSGGEYHTLNDYITKFIQDLKSLGIELEFVLDGAQGTSPEVLDMRTPVWKKRYSQYVKNQSQIISMFSGEKEKRDLGSSLHQLLLTTQLLMTVKACGCHVHCVTEEADCFIALKLQTDLKSFAVLSNDTDFCVFEGGAMIHSEMFDMYKNIKPRPGTLLPMKPNKLICHVVSAEKVRRSLGVCLKSFCLGCPSLQAAVEGSRAFYTLAAVESDEPSNPIAALLGRGMTLGTFHSSLLAMHNGVYWETVQVEQPSLCGKTAETALTDLRKRIYRMVLPEDVYIVTEFGISPTNQHFTGIQVDVDQYRSVPSILNICPEEVQENLQHFERIITHQEVASTKSWFERYGRRTGFLCHILRYFLLLNWKHNLFITQDEFCALFAVVFGSRNVRWHQGLRIKPSPRSATTSAWFQNVYLHAHRLLGGVLCLSDEFPTPADIFSGAVWNSYYAYRKSEGEKCSLRQFLPLIKTA